jgi:hypothetical protein
MNLLPTFEYISSSLEQRIKEANNHIKIDLAMLMIYTNSKFSISTCRAIEKIIDCFDSTERESNQLNTLLKDTLHTIKNDSNDITYHTNYSKKIGKYTIEERSKKILKFKLKQLKLRQRRPILKSFIGRSDSAKIKPRHRGRFVKRKIFSIIKDFNIENYTNGQYVHKNLNKNYISN